MGRGGMVRGRDGIRGWEGMVRGKGGMVWGLDGIDLPRYTYKCNSVLSMLK